MPLFDAEKTWVILFRFGSATVKRAAEDLSRCIGLLSGTGRAPELADPDRYSPEEAASLIILNNESETPAGRGFSWRAAESRIEIFGQGDGGLCKGVYDFLSALGVSWPEPESSGKPGSRSEIFPARQKNSSTDNTYPLESYGNSWYANQSDRAEALAARKRLVIPKRSKILGHKNRRAAVFMWAMRNRFDALVFPFGCSAEIIREAGDYGLAAEAGGWVMSALVPRELFWFHHDIFRMEAGRRTKKVHFCPTNPETIAAIHTQGEKLFRSAKTEVFHIWPQKGEADTWCSCPACRAFTFAEQNRIAVNTAADALARVNPAAFLSFYEDPAGETEIPLRPNVFKINPDNITETGGRTK